MKETVTDEAFHAVVQYGLVDYVEYHALLMGMLCGLICVFISFLNKRIAAVALSVCMIGGLGFLPTVEATYVINEKPWYYLGGLTAQFGLSYLILLVMRKYDIVGFVQDLRKRA